MNRLLSRHRTQPQPPPSPQQQPHPPLQQMIQLLSLTCVPGDTPQASTANLKVYIDGIVQAHTCPGSFVSDHYHSILLINCTQPLGYALGHRSINLICPSWACYNYYTTTNIVHCMLPKYNHMFTTWMHVHVCILCVFMSGAVYAHHAINHIHVHGVPNGSICCCQVA